MVDRMNIRIIKVIYTNEHKIRFYMYDSRNHFGTIVMKINHTKKIYNSLFLNLNEVSILKMNSGKTI